MPVIESYDVSMCFDSERKKRTLAFATPTINSCQLASRTETDYHVWDSFASRIVFTTTAFLRKPRYLWPLQAAWRIRHILRKPQSTKSKNFVVRFQSLIAQTVVVDKNGQKPSVAKLEDSIFVAKMVLPFQQLAFTPLSLKYFSKIC